MTPFLFAYSFFPFAFVTIWFVAIAPDAFAKYFLPFTLNEGMGLQKREDYESGAFGWGIWDTD